jgi:hypothetical protein
MRAPALLLGLATIAVAPRAAAVELTWESPEACPDRANVEQRIHKLLGTTNDKVIAEGRVTATKNGYHLALTTTRDGVRGERALDDASCEALADSAALIVAMAIDPAVAMGIEEPPAPTPLLAAPSPNELPPPSSEVVVAPIADAPAAAVVVQPPSARPRFLIAAGGDVIGLVFPRAALGAAFSVGTVVRSLRFDLGARYAPSSSHELAAPAGASGSFELLVAHARGAWLWSRGDFELGPTLGVEAGRARGRGQGVRTSLEGRAPWFAGSLGGLLTLRTGAFGWSADLAVVVPLTRPSFVIEGAGTVHTPAAIALRAGLSAEVRF